MDESRDLWTGRLAAILTAALQLLMPRQLSAGPGWVAVALVAGLSILFLVTRGPRWIHLHHVVSYLTLAIVTGALAWSTGALIAGVASRHGSALELLRSAALLWATNILVFAGWYWRLDAGGPRERTRREFHATGAFLFPQMTLPEDTRRTHGIHQWQPRFVDYVFLSFNTSTAFSPTDVPVLSRWAKVLMMTQAALSLSTLAVVAARAINTL
jgi:hypothetical protein